MLFSIIITAYNYEKYIGKAVESALNQDFLGEYEIIVVDDFSTDNTRDILDQYDGIVRINNKENLGLEASVNIGIRRANGKYVTRLDADDYLEVGFLREIYMHIQGEDIFLYGDYTVVSENESHLLKVSLMNFDRSEIKCRGDFLATGTVYPKTMLVNAGLYSEEIRNSGLENYQLILGLICNDISGKHIEKNLFFYRRHGGNLSIEKIDSIVSHGQEIAKQYGLDFYAINQYHPYLGASNADTAKELKYINYKSRKRPLC